MKILSKDDISRLRRWDCASISQSDSENEWALTILKNGVDDEGTPALFFAPHSQLALSFAAQNGVNLVQQDADGYTLLHDATYYDLNAFEFLAEYYRHHNAIDMPETEGITPLSAHIKRGNLEYARVLLEKGASPNSFATIKRYGGTRLDLATQAINSIADEGEDQEDLAIKGLALLKKYGLSLLADQKQNLIDRVRDKTKIAQWISANL